MCANMKDPVRLQNTVDGDWFAGQSFHFAIDTCQHWKDLGWNGDKTC